MENRYKINYDFKNRMITNIRFKQGDTDSSVLEFNLIDNGLVKDITDQAITFKFLKGDETVVTQDITTGVSIIDALNGNFQCILKNDALSYPGDVTCEIEFSNAGVILSTAKFNFTVEESVGSGPLSVNYISAIESRLIVIQDAEDIRLASEIIRVDNEITRVDSETIRVDNETIRQNNNTAFKLIEAYDPLKFYIPLNKVTYQGSTYQNILASAGVLPTNATNWILIALAGSGTNVTSSVTNGNVKINGTETKVFNDTSILASLAETTSVKRFGAKGDNIQDDTTFIQNAINSIPITGGTVFFPSGVYKITATLNIPVNVSIEGQGRNQSIIKAYTINQTVFNIVSVATTFTNNSIKNIGILANATGVRGINTVLSSNLLFQNIAFMGCDTNIHCDRGSNFTISNIFSVGLASPDLRAGKSIFESTTLTEYIFDVQITDYQIRNIGNGVNGTSITLNRSVGTFINNYRVNDLGTGSINGEGILITGDCQGCKVIDSIITNPLSYGVKTEALDGSTPITIEISNVDIDQSKGDGIYIKDGFWVNINGGTISTAVGNSVILGGMSNTVSNMHIIDGGIDGVKVLAEVIHFRINNNHIEGNTNAIEILSGASDYFEIANNDISVTNINKIVDNSTGATKLIKNNLGFADSNEYISNTTATLTGGTITEVINVGIPVGIFTSKPLFGNINFISAFSEQIIGFYDYDNVASTATNAVFNLAKNNNTSTLASGARRFCALFKS